MHSHHFLQPILSFPARRFPYADSLIANNEKDHCACKALGAPGPCSVPSFWRVGLVAHPLAELRTAVCAPRQHRPRAAAVFLNFHPQILSHRKYSAARLPSLWQLSTWLPKPSIAAPRPRQKQIISVGGVQWLQGRVMPRKKNGFFSWCFLLEKYSSVGRCRFQAALYFITLGLFLAITQFYLNFSWRLCDSLFCLCVCFVQKRNVFEVPK